MDFDPAGGLLDALPRVVGPPAFHKAHAQNAQPAQVVDSDSRRGRQTCGGISGQSRHLNHYEGERHTNSLLHLEQAKTLRCILTELKNSFCVWREMKPECQKMYLYKFTETGISKNLKK